jgi:hypothetical protein
VSRRLAKLLAAACVLGLAGAALAPSGDARPSGSPFYFAPSPTKECQNLSGCQAVVGPWVVVPPQGESTFLIACPTLSAYLVGGTDARASSGNVRVWFDGSLGAPIGRTIHGAELLFHAVSDNGQMGSFQPILGCIPLKQKNKVSTVSLTRAGALPGTPPASALTLRARLTVVIRGKAVGYVQRTFYAARCVHDEQLVGNWETLAFETTSPPALGDVRAVSIQPLITGREVRVLIRQTSTALLPPQAVVQYGAMCEP